MQPTVSSDGTGRCCLGCLMMRLLREMAGDRGGYSKRDGIETDARAPGSVGSGPLVCGGPSWG